MPVLTPVNQWAIYSKAKEIILTRQPTQRLPVGCFDEHRFDVPPLRHRACWQKSRPSAFAPNPFDPRAASGESLVALTFAKENVFTGRGHTIFECDDSCHRALRQIPDASDSARLPPEHEKPRTDGMIISTGSLFATADSSEPESALRDCSTTEIPGNHYHRKRDSTAYRTTNEIMRTRQPTQRPPVGCFDERRFDVPPLRHRACWQKSRPSAFAPNPFDPRAASGESLVALTFAKK